MLGDILVFALGLSVLVLIHELGHFITAKIAKIKVEEFGIGFPPRLFGIKKGETLYSVNLLPIGGFVKLYGEDDAGGGSLKISKHEHGKAEHHKHEDIKRAFYARPAWQRALIVLAGVIMNFVLAVVIISYLFTFQGVAVPKGYVEIEGVQPNSPAAVAGLRKDDVIVSMNNTPISTTDVLQKQTQQHLGKEVRLTVKRNGENVTVPVTPRTEDQITPEEGPIGIELSDFEVKKFAWYEAPFYGTWEALKFSFLIIQGLGDMIGDLAFRGEKPEGVAGPVGVYQLSAQAADFGINAWLWFMALLSLNLAVMNVLPIPALDGGRLFFILIELVTRKKVNPKYESYAHAIGLAVLLTFLALITFQDVVRMISGQSLLPQP